MHISNALMKQIQLLEEEDGQDAGQLPCNLIGLVKSEGRADQDRAYQRLLEHWQSSWKTTGPLTDQGGLHDLRVTRVTRWYLEWGKERAQEKVGHGSL